MKTLSTIHKLTIMLCGLLIGVNASAYDFQTDDNLFFEVLSTADLTCKLVGVSADYEGDLEIPEKVAYKGKSLTVTSIGSNCIQECTKLKSLSIPSSVSTLESGCFSECISLLKASISNVSSSYLPSDIFKNCTSLIQVDFPPSVNYLPTNFLYGCTDLQSFQIPSWVTTLNSGGFYGCTSLTDIKIPEGVKSIGDECFANSKISSISLPATLKTIGRKCFYGATVPNISLPASVESIGSECFANTHISSLTFEPGSAVTELGYKTFSFSKIEEIILPDNLVKIGENCFASCKSLINLTLPDSMQEISRNGLADLRLESLILPPSVSFMEEWCFGGNFIEFASISHLIWSAENLNLNAYNRYISSKNTDDVTWAAYALESRSFYLGPVDTLEISNSCKFLSLGFFTSQEPTSGPYTGPLLKYSNLKNLILQDADEPLTLGSVYTSGNRRNYELYTTFPDNKSNYFEKYWMENLENLYIGRRIEGNALSVPNLKHLTIGLVPEVNINPSPLHNLEMIESLAQIPPIISAEHFSNDQYTDLLVIVPDDALEAYQTAEVWKNFWNLTTKSDYLAEVTDIVGEAHATAIARYDCWGNRVNPDYSGIVIVRYSDGSTKKYFQ